MPTKQTQFDACMTGVNPVRTHGVGVWGGNREVVGIRIDKNLYAAFKPIAKAYFGSVCRPIEAFMATIIASHNQAASSGVNPSNTIKVDIGELRIERNVRTRRKMVVEEETEVTETVKKVVGCGFCQKAAVAVYEDKLSKIRKYACRFHGNLLESHPKWLFVHEV